MGKIIIIGILLLCLNSCVTRKKCLERFPPKVEIRDSIVIKDTLIYVSIRDTIPGDSVLIRDTIPCPDVKYEKEVKSPSGRISARVKIDKNILEIDCKVDSLERIIDSLEIKLRTKESYHSETKIVEVPVVERVIPWWVWLSYIIIGAYIFRGPLFKVISKGIA